MGAKTFICYDAERRNVPPTYRVGARFGPEVIRSASVLILPFHPELNVSIFERLSGIDYGDFSVVPSVLLVSLVPIPFTRADTQTISHHVS